MNRCLHRIIFNAARGLRMVVQETATSTGKGKCRATGTAVAMGVALLSMASASAQIAGAPNVPGTLRPTVLVAPNGVPLINIQTPSAAGVSRNVYSQFDVGANGAILNNSRLNTQTQLGGWVQGNPFLATGPARIILNEINSGSLSQLRGYIEVGGSRAEVIIANPAGIHVDGGGFINASKATLTTGTPQFGAMGSLDSFLVKGGTVTVDGAGLDAGQTDYAAILARAVQLNAAIYATDLKVVTGAHQISADHAQVTPMAGTDSAAGTAPTFALDVSALGGMYARKIVLVGTEAGLGGRNAGNIGASAGSLVVTAAGRLENTGTLEGRSIQLASAGDIVNRGTIRQTSGAGLTIASSTLSNTDGGVIGMEPVPPPLAGAGSAITSGSAPTNGVESGSSDNTAAAASAPPIPASAGTITAAGAISNVGGKIFAGGPIALQTPQIDNAGGTLSVAAVAVTGPKFSNAGGTLSVSNGFSANVGQLDNTGGKLNAGSLNIATDADLINTDGVLSSATDANLTVGGTLSNGRSGSITAGRHTTITAGSVQSGTASVLAAGIQRDGKPGAVQGIAGELRVTSAGALIANGINIAAGSALLQGAGVDLSTSQTSAAHIEVTATQGDVITSKATVGVTGSLTVTAAGSLNNDGGRIASHGPIVIDAGSMSNRSGQIVLAGADAMRIAVVGALDNSDNGVIGTGGSAVIAAGRVDNSAGTMTAVNGHLTLTTLGQTVNTGGTLQAGGITTLRNSGLANQGGKVFGNSLAVDTQGNALDNSAKGTLAATTTVAIHSGAFMNDAGLVQSGGAMTIDTLAFDNTSKGTVLGQSAVAIDTHGAKYDNSSGQTLAVGDLTVSAGSLVNAGGLIRSVGATVLGAGLVSNTDTQGVNQGIEGQRIAVAMESLDNTSGAIRANVDATITGSGTLTNTQGLISAGNTLAIVDPSRADPAAKTLKVVNTGGTLVAGTAPMLGADGKVQTAAFGKLAIDAKSFSGDGTSLGINDLAIAVTQDLTNQVDVRAGGDLSYSTTGRLTNNGKLLAGGAATVGGTEIENTVGAEISGRDTLVQASGRLTNRGLIDSQGNTRIDATTLTNIGTGRIYGDSVSIAVGTLDNDAETVGGVTKAATIAARGDLDIGATTIHNRNQALMFSAGGMFIGGALDARRQAAGQGGTLDNESASLESLGAMSIAMGSINNVDTHLRVATHSSTVLVPSIITLDGKSWAPFDADGKPITWGDPGTRLVYHKAPDGTVSVIGKGWTNAITQTAVTEDSIAGGTADPARIVAGGNMTLVGQVYNRDSQIMAGGELNAANVDNHATPGKRDTSTSAIWIGYNPNRPGRPPEDPILIPPTTTTETYRLTDYQPQAHLNATRGFNPGAAGRAAVDGVAGGTGGIGAGGRQGAIVEVPSEVPGGVGPGGPGAVRTSTPNVTVPQASLFSVNTSGRYLIETDPRFANYHQWLGSDYLLSQLGLDPNNLQKRLGDGFYEQKLIREQLAQLTGYRYLDGFDSDEDQYAALMNAGATFAKKYGLRPGIALTPAQMAQLTSDIVWLVEQTVTMPGGTTQQVLVPQVYVRVRPGDINGNGAVLSADRLHLKGSGDLVNTGTIAGRTLVEITADNIHNLGGRLSGGALTLTAKTDLDNIGGTIDARDSLTIDAARDINIRSTTQTHGSNTNLDRIAGLYVTNPGGRLVASAGRDLNLIGGIIANQGAGGSTSITAKNDIRLGTVTETRAMVGANSRSSLAMTSSEEIGSSIITNGTTVLAAGRDVLARQATVDAGNGLLSVHADRDIRIESGEARATGSYTAQWSDKKNLSRTDNTLSGDVDLTTSVGSKFSGGLLALTADNDITLEGSHLRGTEGVLVDAGRHLRIFEGRSSTSNSLSSTRTTSGIGLLGGSVPVVGPIKNGSTTEVEIENNVASPSTIQSSQGSVLVQGGGLVTLQGAQLDAAKDIVINGGAVDIHAAENRTSVTGAHASHNRNLGTETWWRDPSTGINARKTTTTEAQDSTLTRTTLQGANVSIAAAGTLAMAATMVNTPGTLDLNADTVILGTQATGHGTQTTSYGRDVVYQKAKDQGTSDQTTRYNQLNAGHLTVAANRIEVGLGARDSIEALGQQPGMGWVEQLNRDPRHAGKIDWVKVEEAHKNWNATQQGLTPEGAAIVTLVVAYFTAGAASELGATAGAAAGGGTVGTVVAGSVTAGVTALAGQAAVALINNQGDIGGALNDLGSSANVRNLLTAIVTGGVLGGLQLDPTGLPTTGSGAQPFVTQLQQNLAAGAARAVIGTAINGGSLEDALKDGLKGAILDTVAAQAAHSIGNLSVGNDAVLDAFTNKVAHAIAGCAVGAARANSAGGCAAGALGAAIGELAAESYGRQVDTTQFAAVISGIAVAVAGGDAGQINLGSQAGANAAGNNYLNHDQWKQLANRLNTCAPGADCDKVVKEFQDLSASQDRALRVACADPGASACRNMLAEAQLGTQTQLSLAQAGRLPEAYLAGSDLNNNVRLVQQRVDAFDIVAACDANPAQCDQRRIDGAMRMAMTGVSAAALTAFSVELGAVGIGMLAEGAGSYCAARPQQCLNLVNGVAEMASGVPYSGVSTAGSWASKVPVGYQRFEGMAGLPPRTVAIADTASGEIRLLTSSGKIIDVPPAPLPPWSSAADNGSVKIVWGQGIQAQGMPWENYLAGQLPAGTQQLPAGFKTFDFYDVSTQTAISAKTLDTMTSSRVGSPTQVYSAIKGYVDEVAQYGGYRLGETAVDATNIAVRELRIAVPASTTTSQWAQIERAVEYANAQGVKILVTGVQ